MTACNEIIYIYSIDNDDCITLIREGDKHLFIIAGKTKEIPDSNYVKIDISKMDLAEGLNVCWCDSSGFIWEVIKTNSKVLINKLDTSKYHFDTVLPLNKNGVPTEMKFRRKGCATILLNSKKCSPPSELYIDW
jgi:hypothetical protein